ncbi:MAG: type II toxin-antitoxin system VapC family toxin [Magnetococcales bacterium]|nr:type II toxin-antitoxin system VapC family toxin [Magnetococcales bacterium]MBF0437839.1 type II toxin-antitoxin system VapC family toxin [Magnetococcales bacterium]
MKPILYLETSIISYLAALPSRDLIVAAHQQITCEWWAERRDRYELFVSELVILEARRGDPNAARRRMAFLDGLKRLSINEQVRFLVKEIIKEGCLPIKAENDAVHIALAAVHGVDYLLTWNCRHIANALTRQKVTDCCRRHGLVASIISTPEELPEEENHVERSDCGRDT